MADHTAVVAAVKQDCINRGINIEGPCGAFNITGRVAWILRDEGWGLVAKSADQNGCTYPDHERYAVDVVALSDGTAIDCLINSETQNIPAWNPTGNISTSAWRAPFNLDSNVPIPPNPPDPTDPSDLEEINRKLDLLIAMMTGFNNAWNTFMEKYDRGAVGTVNMSSFLGGNRPVVLRPKE